MARVNLLLWVACFSALCVSLARADESRAFALVIANNRSTHASQPDLQYADDDGARYYRLFRAVAAAEDVVLLARFDRASEPLVGDLREQARAPSRSELLRARNRLARAIGEARARGERTVLYIVYAGHAEVVEGRGLLDLEDQQIDGAFLERELLEALPADTKHLLLDSCNSFFVINPRKPGGKRWATPKDMAFGFSLRHPEVGLFLSTNSESEVFEWSELESGVFSHEVRSGLRGAADVDQDGAISYLELAGFVERANRGITREALRPQLFFRGPHGDPHAALFSSAALRGRRVVLSEEQSRVWIKSAEGERLLDVHKEPGPLTLVLPEEGELALYEQHEADDARMAISERTLPTSERPLLLASLAETPPTLAARGSRVFGRLFSEPYGPRAFAAYLAESERAPAPVFGVTRADISRMHSYLHHFAAQGKTARRVGAVLAGSFALIPLSGALALSLQPGRADDARTIAGLGVASAGLLAAGLGYGLRASSGEQALSTFERELAAGQTTGAHAFAETEAALQRLAARERKMRQGTLALYLALSAASIGMGAFTLSESAQGRDERRERALGAGLWFADSVVFAAVAVAFRYLRTPSERMLDIYRDDPGVSLQPTLQLRSDGGSVGFARRF